MPELSFRIDGPGADQLLTTLEKSPPEFKTALIKGFQILSHFPEDQFLALSAFVAENLGGMPSAKTVAARFGVSESEVGPVLAVMSISTLLLTPPGETSVEQVIDTLTKAAVLLVETKPTATKLLTSIWEHRTSIGQSVQLSQLGTALLP